MKNSRAEGAALAASRQLSWQPVVVALVLTLLAAFKPIVIDETVYLQYATEIAKHPTDPYAFQVHWYDVPEPANEIFVPPVVPYWLALSSTLLGASVVVAKLSLFPFALAFAFGLAGLLRRLAPGYVAPLLWMTALSPAVLPSFNLMLDVPMLGLSMLAISSFMDACERRDLRRAIVAGLIAGLATQTKYSGVLALVTIGAYALLFARPALGLVSGVCATAIFVAWEATMTALYGESIFLRGITFIQENFGTHHRLGWALSFAGLVGAVLPTVGWLAALVLWPSTRLLAAGGAAIALAFATIAFLPQDPVALQGADYPQLGAWRPELYVFAPVGAIVALAVAVLATKELWRVASIWSAARGIAGAGPLRGLPDRWRWDVFVLAWLAIEVIGFFVLSPYPAARRVIGMGIAATVLAGRVASRSGDRARSFVAVVAFATAALGLLYLVADYSDGRARREAVTRTVARAARAGCTKTWYAGHWGFQHYAERAGLIAIIPGQSRLARGDCLAIPLGVHKQRIARVPAGRREIASIETLSPWPWRTIPSYYVGPVPLRAQSTTHLRVLLFVLTQPWDLRTSHHE